MYGNTEIDSVNINYASIDTSDIQVADIDSIVSVKTSTGSFTGNVSCATINTGQGNNELYDMNQNVQTTSLVQFESINTDWIALGKAGFDAKTLSSDSIVVSGSYNRIEGESGSLELIIKSPK